MAVATCESAVSHTLRHGTKIAVLALGLALFGLCVHRINISAAKSVENARVLCAHQAPVAAPADSFQMSTPIPSTPVPSIGNDQPPGPPVVNPASPDLSDAGRDAPARNGAAQRTLSVLSCWEKLGNAVITMAQVMRMADIFDFEVMLPAVRHSEIGAKVLPVIGSSWSTDLLFETYFDVPSLRENYGRFAATTKDADAIWNNNGIDHMLVMNFDDKMCQLVMPKLEQHRQEYNQTYPIHCVKETKSILALEELYDSLCPEGSRCNIVWYEWRKHLVLPLLSTKYSRLLWSSFNPALTELAFNMLGGSSASPPRYVAVQFRSGAFLRNHNRNRPWNEVVDSLQARADALGVCLHKLIETALEAQKSNGASRVYVASDLYGTIPEWFPEDDLRAIAFNASEDARNYIASFDSVSSTSGLNLSAAAVPHYDPHTLSTMIDVQIALNSVELVTVKHSGTYNSLIVGAKERLGGRVSLIECTQPAF